MAISNRIEGLAGGSSGVSSKTQGLTVAQRNKIVLQEIKKTNAELAKRKKLINEAKVIEVQGKMMTIAEANKLSASIQAKSSVNSVAKNNKQVLDKINKLKNK